MSVILETQQETWGFIGDIARLESGNSLKEKAVREKSECVRPAGYYTSWVRSG